MNVEGPREVDFLGKSGDSRMKHGGTDVNLDVQTVCGKRSV